MTPIMPHILSELLERCCVRQRKTAGFRTFQLSDMRADPDSFSKILSKCSHIGSCGTCHAHLDVSGSVNVLRKNIAVLVNEFQKMNRYADRLTFNLFAAAREFVELFAPEFFRRIHRRHLLNLSSQSF